MSCPDPVPATIGAFAAALATELSSAELAVLAAFFTQLGDSLGTILARRAFCDPDL